MFNRCLFCHRDLPANEGLEHFPVGRRVAYDPVRGRLWAVCPACHRWNLAPIEERWEALDELEKAVKDKAKLLSQTDNIALLRTPELEIVRVGRANLTEEAWWRYGIELVKRRRVYQLLTAAGVAGVLGLMAGGAAAGVGVFGGWWILGRAGRQLPKIGRTLKFGRTAWQGRAVCPRCGNELVQIPFRARGALVAHPDGEEGLNLSLRCLNCEYGPGSGPRSPAAVLAVRYGMTTGSTQSRREQRRNPWNDGGSPWGVVAARRGREPKVVVPPWNRAVEPGSIKPDPQAESGFLIRGVEAEHVLRRVLAFQNFAGAKEDQVRRATSLIEQAGSAPSLAQRITASGRQLGTIDPTSAIALEIAVNEDRERRMLELELAALEARWREEEEIAAISDGELTWIGGATQPPPDRAITD